MSFLDAFKSSMMDVLTESKRNPVFAEELLDKLFDWLDEEMESRINYQNMHSSLSDIAAHLSVVSNKYISNANVFYEGISNIEVKGRPVKDSLVEFHAKYLQSRSNGDFPLCCKFLFKQIESLVNFLVFKRDILNKLTNDEKFRLKYEQELSQIFSKKTEIKPNKKGVYEIPLFFKISIISDEYKSEFSKISLKYIDIRSFFRTNNANYRRCYELRNMDSHGLAFEIKDANQIEIDDFEQNASTYLRTPLEFLEYLTSITIKVQNE